MHVLVLSSISIKYVQVSINNSLLSVVLLVLASISSTTSINISISYMLTRVAWIVVTYYSFYSTIIASSYML